MGRGISLPFEEPLPVPEPEGPCITETWSRSFSYSVTDDFVDPADFGTSDSGEPWVAGYVEAGFMSSATVEIVDGALHLLMDAPSSFAAASGEFWEMPAALDGNFDIRCRLRQVQGIPGNTFFALTVLGYNGITTQHNCHLTFLSDDLYVSNPVGGLVGPYQANAPHGMPSDTWLRLRFQREEGVAIRGKVWVDGDPEPGAWTVEFDISGLPDWPTGLLNPGQMPLFRWSTDSSGDTGEFFFDDLDIEGVNACT